MRRTLFRIIRYLGPYRALLTGAIIATFGFAIFDGLSIIALIPLLNALFHAGALEMAGTGRISWLLTHTVGQMVPPGLPPQQVLLRINLFILVVFLIKNIFDFFQQ